MLFDSANREVERTVLSDPDAPARVPDLPGDVYISGYRLHPESMVRLVPEGGVHVSVATLGDLIACWRQRRAARPSIEDTQAGMAKFFTSPRKPGSVVLDLPPGSTVTIQTPEDRQR